MYPFFKRLLDLFIATVALIILSPIFLVVTLVLKFTGEREVLYLQERIGLNNQHFYIWKYATMLKNSANMAGGLITVRNDSRVTPFGKILRMTKINELPQIFNVIKGDMSIVGPRPLVDKSFEPYSDFVKANIYKVRPGITGIGSLIFRDEEKLVSDCKGDKKLFYDTVIAPYKGELEMWYQRNKSMTTDILIIFLTAWSILFPKNQLVHKLFRNLPDRSAHGLQ